MQIEEQTTGRARWKSKYGFVLASMGAAVGLANIWMFPWRVGQFGGAAFLIPYFIFLLLIGLVGLMIEWGLGRSQDGGPMIAFQKAGFPMGKWVGIFPLIAAILAMAFYCNIIGWSLKFLYGTLTGAALQGEPGQFFDSVAFQPEARLWFALTVALTTFIVAFGVRKGIEFAAKIMMPFLFIMLLAMALWAVTLPGALEGLKFYLLPDLSKLTPEAWLTAMSQSVFTLSLGGGAMVVYGSYMRKKDDIVTSAISVGFGNTTVAILAGFAIFPAVFSFGLSPDSGPKLAFVSIPLLLKSMPGGMIWGLMFFASLFIAGITSTVGIIQVVVDGLGDQYGWNHKAIAMGAGIVCLILGWPGSTNPQYFGLLVNIVATWMLPILALVAGIAFLWCYGAKKAREHVNIGTSLPLGTWWEPWAKYIYPVIIAAVLVVGITMGISG